MLPAVALMMAHLGFGDASLSLQCRQLCLQFIAHLGFDASLLDGIAQQLDQGTDAAMSPPV